MLSSCRVMAAVALALVCLVFVGPAAAGGYGVAAVAAPVVPVQTFAVSAVVVPTNFAFVAPVQPVFVPVRRSVTEIREVRGPLGLRSRLTIIQR